MDEGLTGTENDLAMKADLLIKPFEDEVLCDVAPLSVVNALFGKP